MNGCRTTSRRPGLPYSQPLDVSRSYLRALDTSRLAAMRAFREHITEYALDPALPPPGFQTHLWRYPLRLELTVELLGLTPEEFNTLFQNPGTLPPWELYGFASQTTGGTDWTQVIAVVPEFLKRTGLTYCELGELQRSDLAEFRYQQARDGALPGLRAVLPGGHAAGLRRRTRPAPWCGWPRSSGCGARCSMPAVAATPSPSSPTSTPSSAALAGGLNSEFIRQLGALQALRCDFQPAADRPEGLPAWRPPARTAPTCWRCGREPAPASGPGRWRNCGNTS